MRKRTELDDCKYTLFKKKRSDCEDDTRIMRCDNINRILEFLMANTDYDGRDITLKDLDMFICNWDDKIVYEYTICE